MSLRRRVFALGFPGCQNIEIRVEEIVESITGSTFDLRYKYISTYLFEKANVAEASGK